MKIAFIYDTAFPWVTGGAERRIYEIGTRLSKRGHDVHMYSLGYWMNSKEYENQEVIEYNGITYHSVGKAMDLYTENNTRSIKEAIYFATKILTNSKLDSFDIVDCQGFPYFSCYTSKIKTKKNLIITVHEVWNDYWYEYMGKKGFIGKIIEKGIFYLTNNIICVSQSTYNNMIENHLPKNTSIIANGVNCDEISHADASDEYSDVIFAGRLIPEKHVDLLINGIYNIKEDYPNIKCKIVGSGPDEEHLKKLASSLNLNDNIQFEGFYDDHEKLYSAIKCSKVFVLPSKREGFGIVVIEANCCGVPVITLNNPMNAAKDLIVNDNGWLIEDDSKQLAKLLKKILDEDISDEIKNKCILFAKDYDWDYITSLTENYYLDIVTSNK